MLQTSSTSVQVQILKYTFCDFGLERLNLLGTSDWRDNDSLSTLTEVLEHFETQTIVLPIV